MSVRLSMTAFHVVERGEHGKRKRGEQRSKNEGRKAGGNEGVSERWREGGGIDLQGSREVKGNKEAVQDETKHPCSAKRPKINMKEASALTRRGWLILVFVLQTGVRRPPTTPRR